MGAGASAEERRRSLLVRDAQAFAADAVCVEVLRELLRSDESMAALVADDVFSHDRVLVDGLRRRGADGRTRLQALLAEHPDLSCETSTVGLAAHVPRIVQRICAGQMEGPVLRSDEFEAALLFADISGFTRLATQVSVEELKQHINSFFSALLSVVFGSGGDVIKFAGDAMLILWSVTEGECDSLEQAVRSAALCALQIEEHAGRYTVGEVTLRLHSGLGCGRMQGFHVGSEGRFEYLIDGPCMAQIAAAEGEAGVGETVASAEAWALLEPVAGGTPTPSGNVRLDSVLESVVAVTPAPLDLDTIWAGSVTPFVHPVAVRAIESGSESLLAELREVVVLFVNVSPHTVPTEVHERGEQLQSVFERCNGALAELGGMVRQFIVDDKGTVLIGTFGLAKQEDDCGLALTAATNIVTRLASMNVSATVGVTLGSVYCGLVGAPSRCEYAMMGPSVNLSARLMASKANQGVLCDGRVHRRCELAWEFEALDPIVAKGYADPVAVFKPVRQRMVMGMGMGMGDGTPPPVVDVVGRTEELALLDAALDGFMQAPALTALVLEGGGGTGKSNLLQHLCRRATAAGLPVITGCGSATQRNLPNAIWKSAAGCLGFTPGPVDPSMPIGDQLKAGVDELVDFLKHEVCHRPTGVLLVLENAHWLEPMSWRTFLRVLSPSSVPVLCALATRPMSEYQNPVPHQYVTLLEKPYCTRITVGRLRADSCERLACITAGCESLAPGLGARLAQRTDGNPLFVVELVSEMVSKGLLTKAGELTVDLDAAIAELPSTVQDAVMARVDRLGTAAQSVLKASSVCGMEFHVSLVRMLEPCGKASAAFAQGLQECVRTMVLDEVEGGDVYRFHHAMIREAVYSLMLDSQRSQLHRALAEHLAAGGDEEPVDWTVLAGHWQAADEPLKAAAAWLRATVRLAQYGENHSACVCAEQGLQQLDKVPGQGAELRLQLLVRCAQSRMSFEDFSEAVLTEIALAMELYEAHCELHECEEIEASYLVLLALRCWTAVGEENSKNAVDTFIATAGASSKQVNQVRALAMRTWPMAHDACDWSVMQEAADRVLAMPYTRELQLQVVNNYGSDHGGVAVGISFYAHLAVGNVDRAMALLQTIDATGDLFRLSHVRSRMGASFWIVVPLLLHGFVEQGLDRWQQTLDWILTIPAERRAGSLSSFRAPIALVTLLGQALGREGYGASVLDVLGLAGYDVTSLEGRPEILHIACCLRGELEALVLRARGDAAGAEAVARAALDLGFPKVASGVGRLSVFCAPDTAFSEFERLGMALPALRLAEELGDAEKEARFGALVKNPQ